jgi:hypothetical protein
LVLLLSSWISFEMDYASSCSPIIGNESPGNIDVLGHYRPSHASFGPVQPKKTHYGTLSYGAPRGTLRHLKGGSWIGQVANLGGVVHELCFGLPSSHEKSCRGDR